MNKVFFEGLQQFRRQNKSRLVILSKTLYSATVRVSLLQQAVERSPAHNKVRIKSISNNSVVTSNSDEISEKYFNDNNILKKMSPENDQLSFGAHILYKNYHSKQQIKKAHDMQNNNKNKASI